MNSSRQFHTLLVKLKHSNSPFLCNFNPYAPEVTRSKSGSICTQRWELRRNGFSHYSSPHSSPYYCSSPRSAVLVLRTPSLHTNPSPPSTVGGATRRRSLTTFQAPAVTPTGFSGCCWRCTIRGIGTCCTLERRVPRMKGGS